MKSLAVRRLIFATLALAAVLALLWRHERNPAPAYRIEDLGIIPGATNSQGTAINASGDVTGRMFWTGASQPPYNSSVHAFLWHKGRLTDLGTLPGLPDSTSCGLNNQSQIVGYARISGVRQNKNSSSSYQTYSAFTFQNGRMTRLPALPGYPDSAAFAVNDSGQIVGADHPKDAETGRGFLYSHGVLIDLGLLPSLGGRNAGSAASGINQAGEIVGTASASTGFGTVFHGFLYRNGKMTDLGSLPGLPDSSAIAINDQGQVTGYVAQTGPAYPGIRRAFLWQKGLMKELGTLPGYRDSSGEAINSQGEIVGFAMSLPPFESRFHDFLHEHGLVRSASDDLPPHAFLYNHSKIRDLNDLIPVNLGWVLESANGINDRGQIVGTGLHHGQRRAFVLTPLHH